MSWYCNFNSTVVRLKLEPIMRWVKNKGIFQFYCSAIKTKQLWDMKEYQIEFQFYCSAIKTQPFRKPVRYQ